MERLAESKTKRSKHRRSKFADDEEPRKGRVSENARHPGTRKSECLIKLPDKRLMKINVIERDAQTVDAYAIFTIPLFVSDVITMYRSRHFRASVTSGCDRRACEIISFRPAN